MELKKLIDSAPLYLPAVGYCLSLEQEFIKAKDDTEDSDVEDSRYFPPLFKEDIDVYQKENTDKPWSLEDRLNIETESTDSGGCEVQNNSTDGNETSDDELDKYSAYEYNIFNRGLERRDYGTTEVTIIKGIQKNISRLYSMREYVCSYDGLNEDGLTIQGTTFTKMGDIEREDVERWYNAAKNSGFGNVSAQETQQNPMIRSSRELDATQFNVEQTTLDFIAEIWARHLTPQKVNVQPYKLVIYGPGDHFTWHKDTPETNLCGTFLISIFSDCAPRDVFEILQNGVSKTWHHELHEWCAFYPDTPHRVSPLVSGYRAILSFKVFAQDSDFITEDLAREKSLKMDGLLDEIAKSTRTIKSLGILLKHHYGYNSKSVYGCDEILLKYLKDQDLRVDLKLVLIHMKAVGPNPSFASEKRSVKSSVYYLTDDALDVVRQKLRESASPPSKRRRKNPQNNSGEGIVFIDGVRRNKSGLWESQLQQAAENTGNESRPSAEDSVYVRYAAVIKVPDAK